MRRLVLACAVFSLLGPTALAGVVLEMEVADADAPGTMSSERFQAQADMTRMDSLSADGKRSSVIFRDQTMYFVDHGKRLCQTIDKKSVDELSRQLGAVMKELEKLPPEQRAMMEKMMKGKVPGGEPPPEYRVEARGEDQVGDYPCTLYALYSAADKVQDVCLADKSAGDDIFDAMGAFRALAEFTEGSMKVAGDMPFGKMIEMPYQELDEMEGFPVRTRFFDADGEITRERSVKAIRRQDIDVSVFEIPEGYKVKSLEKELQKSGKR